MKLIIFRRKKGKKFIRIGGKKCINFRYPESLNTFWYFVSVLVINIPLWNFISSLFSLFLYIDFIFTSLHSFGILLLAISFINDSMLFNKFCPAYFSILACLPPCCCLTLFLFPQFLLLLFLSFSIFVLTGFFSS